MNLFDMMVIHINEELMTSIQKTYYDNGQLTVVQPEMPLAPGAISIVSKTANPCYASIFQVYQNFKQLGAACYYLERQDGTRQIIPYPHKGIWSWARQLLVTWNLLVPRLAWVSKTACGQDVEAALAKEPVENVPAHVSAASCPFCKPGQIAAQQVLEEGDVRLLYNFKPVTSKDFLIVAKEHVRDFNEPLFVQMLSLAKRVTDAYHAKGYKISYVSFADAPASGRTLEHLLVHVSIAKDWKEEVKGIITVVRKIVLDSWAQFLTLNLFRLSNADLKMKIDEAKRVLGT